MNLSKREIKLLIFALVIVLGISIIKWAVLPLKESYKTLNYKINQQEEIYQKSKLKIKNADLYTTKLNIIERQLKTIKPLFFNKTNNKVQVEMLNILDRLIKQSGLKLKSKNIQVRDSLDDFFSNMQCRLSLVGKMEELVKLLDSISKTRKLLMVKELKIKGDRSNYLLSIEMSVQILNRKDGS